MVQEYAAIIPVAGLSSRMGVFKPLLELEGLPMIERTVRSVLCGGAARVCVVTGREAHRVEAALAGLGSGFSPETEPGGLSASTASRLLFRHNPHYANSDMLQSIKLGLGALLEGREGARPSEALFVIPGDMPGVDRETFALLKGTLERETEGHSVFVPLYQGRRGHPLLIGSTCYEAVLGFEGEGGLKQALAGFDWQEVPTDDPGIRLDADTPDAFEKLAVHIARRAQ